MKKLLLNIFVYGPYFNGWKNSNKRFWTSLIVIVAFLIVSTQVKSVFDFFNESAESKSIFKLIFGVLGFFFIRDSIVAGFMRFGNDLNNMSDKELDKAMKRPFKMNKTCPYCLKPLPSVFVKKCPHCTADI
jgi:hypothetical protein